jgi:hypothetical protein
MAKHRHEKHKKEHEKKEHFKRGGHVKLDAKDDLKGADDYSGSGKPEVVKAAESRKDSFKKGGKVMGHKSKARMDKYARGGRAGGSPFSSAKIKENTAA